MQRNEGTVACEAKLRRRFGNRMGSLTTLNRNEVHLTVQDKRDVPEVCLFARDELRGRLATVVCTEEEPPEGPFALRYVFSMEGGQDAFVVVTVRIARDSALTFPSIALSLPAATLYEREIRDMFGLIPEGNPDDRPLVVHEEWPQDVHPLRKEFDLHTKVERGRGRGYRFLKVEGEGVSEIPVGPVHAGIIEPGHFRFSVLGENIVNLETRLFYTHRGVEKLAESLSPDQLVLLSERISGDEAVANSTAYCQAIEKIAGVEPPQRALQIRVVCAEMERVYNHIGTLAGLSMDAGFAYGSSRLNILKERMMRLNEEVAGSRLLFGVNRIGGVGVDLKGGVCQRVLETTSWVLDDFGKIVSLLKNDSSVMDRFRGTGTIRLKEAEETGLVGVAARSSGLDVDTRRDHPYGAYRLIQFDGHRDTPRHIIERGVEMAKRKGDVLARFETRVEEVTESVDVMRTVLGDLSPGSELLTPLYGVEFKPYAHALGYAESHRGQTVHWVMLGERPGTVFRYKVRTASFANWPSIEGAVLNDIVADFPLVNKSLDLSYAGNDL